MSDWNASQYLKFNTQRTQPAQDLAMRVKDLKPKTVADIGCGPGNSTAVLAAAFPDSDILGIDSSPSMIEKAKKEHPNLKFMLCDALSLPGRYDLLFSNACLQWIPDHAILIPALMDKLTDGGVLAVQMPMNGEEPLFRLISETADRWGLAGVKAQPNETLTPPEYFDILTACSASFDMWETKYYHSLADHQSLIDWVKGTRLRPYLDFLGKEKGEEFETEILQRAKELYTVMSDGSVVLGFRRYFFTAVK